MRRGVVRGVVYAFLLELVVALVLAGVAIALGWAWFC